MKKILKFSLLPLSILALTPVHAATRIDLMKQPVTSMNSFVSNQTSIIETSRSGDLNNTLHVRIQETYLGYSIFGADAVVHIPHGMDTGKKITDVIAAANRNKGFMNGNFYQNINVDLANTPAIVFEQSQAQKASERAVENYYHKIGSKPNLQDMKKELLVYIDKNNKAHWAYKVNFYVAPLKKGMLPAKPAYIMDAVSFEVYKQWNDIKTGEVSGGGFGGNLKMGKLVYDGLEDHLAKLTVFRNDNKVCLLKNSEVTVKSEKTNSVISYKCPKRNAAHNNLFWDGDQDKVNGGYSPGNDALFGGAVIKHMYQDWYNVPVLTNEDGTPMMLNMVVHSDMDNAYWDGTKMVFGDGVDMFYPLTSLGVAAHEISHGFTEQHSNLYYDGQSGGMNEAFSDMAAQAAEVYAYGPGKNSWQIGPEIFKAADEALRYMDIPSKDCHGGQPGDWCSIDDASQYTDFIDVHFSSGVYNRFFYTLGTTAGWDARKAFDVMVQANSHYWTSDATFSSGACGVIQAATDLNMDVAAVKAAFDVVKVSYSECQVAH